MNDNDWNYKYINLTVSKYETGNKKSINKEILLILCTSKNLVNMPRSVVSAKHIIVFSYLGEHTRNCYSNETATHGNNLKVSNNNR